ncbi:MAG TPA: PAS domain S-box protein, partial [Gemmatimonadaceae bacterium]|nr:PAS domain S-box protein [Gemmatimonadaceae bacterium]
MTTAPTARAPFAYAPGEERSALGAHFEAIIAIAADAIICTDAGQRITLFNRGAEVIFGYTAAEVVGQPLGLLM